MLSAQDKSKRATKWQELLQWIGCEGFKLRSFKFQIHSMWLSHLLRKSTIKQGIIKLYLKKQSVFIICNLDHVYYRWPQLTYRLTIDWYIGQLSVSNRPTIGRQLTDSWPTVNQQSTNRLTDSRPMHQPICTHLSVDHQSTIGRQSTDYWSIVDW